MRKWLRGSRLRWQLMISYLPLIITPLILTALVTRGVTEQGLTLFTTGGAQRRAEELAPQFATYYAEHGSWEGLPTVLFIAPPRPPWLPVFIRDDMRNDDVRADQLLIVDTNGVIVASDHNNGVGQLLSADALKHGVRLLVNGTQIGTLVMGAALGVIDAQQRQLLDAVNAALVASGVISALLAAALGLGLSWQITRPVQQLTIGVRRLASGQWTEPLEITSDNEFGDLTQAFNTMAAEVTRQQQLRRQMVADVAHDLRTPLSAMLLDIEAIEAGLQSPAEAAVSLREEITWLQRLVDDLRILSLMDADQLHLHKVPTALTPFLEGVFDFWQSIADEGQRHLQLDITSLVAQSLPAVPLDTGRMRQVLSNLIDNAIQHTEVGGHITIGGCVEDSAHVMLYVADDGRGINEDDVPHVFERFYRADRAHQHDSSSNGAHNNAHSGLGLSIAQRLVELHGGIINVQSEPGYGAAFRVTLPIKG